ncbi:guanine-N(7)-methyltransferase [Rhizodiscina lignyota]|uniref:mRNA cap guanine-N(7) methyltransferase n=1 Tax=Rhizodiscina lignyota TaxID=1504668 RepID=A0A9P4IEP3_9PEZI|nr:guanine-N(7)-methyltransferase [Rhizodiscina lignyota]
MDPPPPQEEPPKSPPRKRPGRTSVLPAAKRKRDEEEEQPDSRPQKQKQPANKVPDRGVENIVREHYNNVPERGAKWRTTDSKITGLRVYNNWCKSVLINKAGHGTHRANVLDIGCGKGGDLQKWAPQHIANYIGLDIADVSIQQAKERYREGFNKRKLRFHADFIARDCFSGTLADVPQVASIGYDTSGGDRWAQGGGFDVVSIMFVMHYAFESEQKARTMLQNVSNSLKKGGKFIGVIPNSDVISDKVAKGSKEWGNSIYSVRFPGEVPSDGVFRPPFGWKYIYHLEEAVDAPEYVIPWESLRGLAEDYNLELEFRMPFKEIWEEEKDDREFGMLAEKMRVKDPRTGELRASKEELEAAYLYQGFIFYKV